MRDYGRRKNIKTILRKPFAFYSPFHVVINRFHRSLAQTKANELTFAFITLKKCDLYDHQPFSDV